MNTFTDFLNALGGLHDAIVVSINWQAEEKTLEFVLDDVYANFRGMTEYPGRRTSVIRLKGIDQLTIDLDGGQRLRVFEFLPDERQPGMVLVKFSPGGHITARYTTAEHPANELMHST